MQTANLRQSENLRHLRLDGTRNLRDIGGYATRDGRRTRWRTLLRSDCLDRLSPDGQAWLIDHRLRTAIDLRDNREVAERPNVFATSSRVRYLRVPMFDEPPPDDVAVEDLADGYWRMLQACPDRLLAVFRALAAPDALPALVHCHAGKDRTGVVVAMVLGALGVPDDVIVEDYTLSNSCLGPEFAAETRAWFESRGLDWAVYGHLASAPASLMRDLLRRVGAEYGGVRNYLERHGLPATALARLVDALTEVPTGI